jgi:hypothetical protein
MTVRTIHWLCTARDAVLDTPLVLVRYTLVNCAYSHMCARLTKATYSCNTLLQQVAHSVDKQISLVCVGTSTGCTQVCISRCFRSVCKLAVSSVSLITEQTSTMLSYKSANAASSLLQQCVYKAVQ